MSENKDVFISYHGGDGDESKSSYQMAEKLKDYLETHDGQKFSCFLCKKEKRDDFYDAINEALLAAKHFILVAQNKEMLSEWVYDEVKQFDGLRKKGKKDNNCLFNAFIYGDLTIDSLCEFNTVFVTKDIQFGEDGFAKLYEMLVSKNNTFSSNYSIKLDTDINTINYVPVINKVFINKIIPIIEDSKKSCILLTKKILEDISIYESVLTMQFLEKNNNVNSLNIVVCSNPFITINCLISKGMTDNACILDKTGKTLWIVKDGELLHLELNKRVEIESNNCIIEFRRIEYDDEETIEMCYRTDTHNNQKKVLLESAESGCYNSIVGSRFSNEDCAWEQTEFAIDSTNGYRYLLQAMCEEKVLGSSIQSTQLVEMLDYLNDVYDSTDYCMEDYSKMFNEFRESYLLFDEILLQDYYHFFKSEKKTDVILLGKLSITKYGMIARRMKNFYLKHDPSDLDYVIRTLFKCAEAEKKTGSYYSYVFLMRLLSEIYIHNVFVLEKDFIDDEYLLNPLKEILSIEYDHCIRLKIRTMICAFEKEVLFCGHYSKIDSDSAKAQNIVLADFNSIINDIMSTADSVENNKYKPELVLLYRQRCVIWEHNGDTSLDSKQRCEFYNKWQDDCLAAIDICKNYDADKELLGCVYLNYASAQNRLSCFTDDKRELLEECLKNLETALHLFRGSSADRYLAYVWLHKADCCELMYKNTSPVIDIDCNKKEIKELNGFALQAWELFKSTSDEIAKCWTNRLLAKGKILLSTRENLLENTQKGLSILREALCFCNNSTYANGMASIVKDFTDYIYLIEKYGIVEQLYDDLTKTFLDEIQVCTTIIRTLPVEKRDIYETQKQIERIFTRLLN